MNWSMITVLVTVVLSVAAALWVVFSTGKSSSSYLRFYARNGYRPDSADDYWYRSGQ